MYRWDDIKNSTVSQLSHTGCNDTRRWTGEVHRPALALLKRQPDGAIISPPPSSSLEVADGEAPVGRTEEDRIGDTKNIFQNLFALSQIMMSFFGK